MTFYAVTPPLCRFLRRRHHRIAWTAGGAVLSIALGELLMYDTWRELMDVFYRVPVFLLGFFVAEERPLGKRDVLFWTVWAVLGAGYLYLSLTDPEGFPCFSMCYLFLFTTVPMCLLGCFLFAHLPLGGLRRFLRLIGENSLEIYLLNVSVFCEMSLLERVLSPVPGPELQLLVLVALNIGSGLVLHQAVEWGRRRAAARSADSG